MPKPIVTVDCTLRDGGYYNKWDFPPDVVQRYLDAMERLSIDYIEFGFRGFKQDQFFDELKRTLKFPRAVHSDTADLDALFGAEVQLKLLDFFVSLRNSS